MQEMEKIVNFLWGIWGKDERTPYIPLMEKVKQQFEDKVNEMEFHSWESKKRGSEKKVGQYLVLMAKNVCRQLIFTNMVVDWQDCAPSWDY